MSKLSAKLLDELGILEMNRGSVVSKMVRARGVVRSLEFIRVRDLSRRILLGEDDGERLALAVSDLLYWAAGGEGPSPLPLRPMQAAMLADCAEHRGMTVSLPVGGGKSWSIALLAAEPGSVPQHLLDMCGGAWPQVFCERPVLLLPPSVKSEMVNDVLPTLKRAYRVHPNLKLVAYSELQTVKGADILVRLRPDMLACDEVDSLKNKSSARTTRVRNYLKANPDTVFAGMTGTLADRSLRDLHQIVMWSHPLDPPLPRGWKETEDWCNAVDADVDEADRIQPGALLELCLPDETPREGLARRLAETSGIILAGEQSCDKPLLVEAVKGPELPQTLTDALANLDAAWVTPDGMPIADAARWAMRAREMALGFYYVWDWSRCTKDGKPDYEWLEAKKDWNDVVRGVCRRGNADWDSELRVRNACRAGELPHAIQADAREALARWETQSKKPEPETRPVWLTDVVMRWVVEWARQNAGIVWYEHLAVENWIMRNASNMMVYLAGMDDELRLYAKSARAGKTTIFCSRPAHHKGKNLQAWNDNLVLTPSPSGKVWEQLLGRTHRAGQQRDVRCQFLASTYVAHNSMTDAVNRARFTFEQIRAPQKLLECEFLGWTRQ